MIRLPSRLVRHCAGLLFAAAFASSAAPAFASATPYLILHRAGVVDDANPENSLGALRGAIADHYPYVEFDLRMTRDGVIVCLHDRSLKRTLGLDLNVDDLTLRELYARVSPEKVPTLEAFASLAEGKLALMPDIKGEPPQLTEIFKKKLRAILKKHRLLHSALFIGEPAIIESVGGGSRYAWRGHLDEFRRLVKADPGIVHRVFAFNHVWDFSKEDVAAYRAMGVPVVLTINLEHYHHGDPLAQGKRDVGRGLALDVDGLQIDSVYSPFVWAAERTR